MIGCQFWDSKPAILISGTFPDILVWFTEFSVLFANCHKYGQAKKMRIGLILRPWQIRFLVYLVSSLKSSNPQDVSDNKFVWGRTQKLV